MRLPQPPPPSTLDGTHAFDWLARLGVTGATDDKGRYLHWDELRRKTPPEGVTPEQWWTMTKLHRATLLKPLPLRSTSNRPFRVATPDSMLRILHEIDKNTAGNILVSEVQDGGTRNQYIVNALMEEAITSSQLEGAATTREVAKDLLRSGRSPRGHGEKMIVNNYATMERIRELRAEPLTPEVVLELHTELSRDTLEDPAGVGRLRFPGEDIKVMDDEGQVLHRPPPAEQLPARLAAMCMFANADDDATPFVHPVVRSILLHFWLAYDHPFVDGNGRTARALFYWSMLRRGYWLFEFITISRILRRAPAAYARAFLHAETDEDDATYFVVHQLSVIERAIGELQSYLRDKMQRQRELQSVLRASVVLNHRQRELLQHALRHPAHSYTLEGHQRSHDVAYQTARTDVLDLVERGLLIQHKVGKRYVFEAERDLEARLKRLR